VAKIKEQVLHVLSHCKQLLPSSEKPSMQAEQTLEDEQAAHPTGQIIETPPTTAEDIS